MNIRLTVMTRELCREYHRGFAYDPAMFPDGNCSKQYVYDEQQSDAHWQRQRDLNRIHLAIMLDSCVIGDAVLKSIDQNAGCCTMGIHLQNDTFKNQGYGTEAEIQILTYAFQELGMSAVYADALVQNERSQHVLEKVGFRETHRSNDFVYYVCEKASWTDRESIYKHL